MAEEFIESPQPAGAPRPWARTILVLQAALVACVVAWVLDLPQKAGVALYTEQFLVTVLGLALALCFLIAPATPRFKGRVPWWDAVAAFLGLALCLWIAWRYPALVYELASRPLDGILMSAALAVLVLEGTRRMTGFSLVGFTLAGVVYAMLGHHLPGVFQARPVDFTRLVVYLGLDTNALLGTSLNIAIIVVVPFILLGTLLSRCGGSEFFTDLAMAWMGRYRGGAAKIAVAGSAFFGMISGSAVANVSAVGVVTIPMMKRSGFPAQIAAAIEAVGSTGGQLMPPVMGAAAFLMAEVLQVPYVAVMIAAIIPAFLYYLALFFQVDLEAAKRGILGEPAARTTQTLAVLKAGWYFPLPFGLLVYALVVWNWRAEYAALAAAAVLIACSLAFGYKGERVPLKDMLKAIVATGGAVVDLILICAVAGMFIGILNITGLAFGMTLQLLAITGESLPWLLALTAIMAILLGLGLAHRRRVHHHGHPDRAGAGEGRHRADGGAHVPALLRDHVDGDAAGRAVRVRGREHRRRRRRQDRLDRDAHRLGGLHRAVPVRAVAEPADAGPPARHRLGGRDRGGRDLARDDRRGRLLLRADPGAPARALHRRRGADPDPGGHVPWRHLHRRRRARARRRAARARARLRAAGAARLTRSRSGHVPCSPGKVTAREKSPCQ